jgi:hypothetical protein
VRYEPLAWDSTGMVDNGNTFSVIVFVGQKKNVAECPFKVSLQGLSESQLLNLTLKKKRRGSSW